MTLMLTAPVGGARAFFSQKSAGQRKRLREEMMSEQMNGARALFALSERRCSGGCTWAPFLQTAWNQEKWFMEVALHSTAFVAVLVFLVSKAANIVTKHITRLVTTVGKILHVLLICCSRCSALWDQRISTISFFLSLSAFQQGGSQG
jgi:hypothetical protein